MDTSRLVQEFVALGRQVNGGEGTEAQRARWSVLRRALLLATPLGQVPKRGVLVRLVVAGEVLELVPLTVGPEGCTLELAGGLSPGESLVLLLVLAGGHLVAARARVLSVRPTEGGRRHALEFDPLSEEDREALAEAVETLAPAPLDRSARPPPWRV